MYTMVPLFRRPGRSSTLLAAICLSALFFASGCVTMPAIRASGERAPASGILVTTHDRSTFQFQEGSWSLTLGGIEGKADILTETGTLPSRDTTLWYGDVASAAAGGGRGSTVTQFLLTILGVILVIGLAALILYAAFPATDR